MRFVAIGILVILAGATAGYLWVQRDGAVPSSAGAGDVPHQVQVIVPALDALQTRGAVTFASKCAACHGPNASGGPGGPPLVHIIYEPGHHADGSFVAAIRQGVRQHHWNFGNMAPVPGISDPQIQEIIAYVRALQRANGID